MVNVTAHLFSVPSKLPAVTNIKSYDSLVAWLDSNLSIKSSSPVIALDPSKPVISTKNVVLDYTCNTCMDSVRSVLLSSCIEQIPKHEITAYLRSRNNPARSNSASKLYGVALSSNNDVIVLDAVQSVLNANEAGENLIGYVNKAMGLKQALHAAIFSATNKKQPSTNTQSPIKKETIDTNTDNVIKMFAQHVKAHANGSDKKEAVKLLLTKVHKLCRNKDFLGLMHHMKLDTAKEANQICRQFHYLNTPMIDQLTRQIISRISSK